MRTWSDSWSNRNPRAWAGVARDADDFEFQLRGNQPEIAIDGAGIAKLSGVQPRMYVWHPDRFWLNVEVTIWHRYVAPSVGLVVGARSNHHNATAVPCDAKTYYAGWLADGKVVFRKELKHDSIGQIYAPPRTVVQLAPLEMNRWYGLRSTVMNLPNGHVELRAEVAIDNFDWRLAGSTIDVGDWQVDCDCPLPPGQILTEPGRSVFVRNSNVTNAEYRDFAIREIAVS